MKTSIAWSMVLLLWPGLVYAEWKPAHGPLSTRWTKDVSPDKVHPEYPRPQMTRPEWQNLNGIWQFAQAGKEDMPPLGKNLDGQILVPFPVESALSGVMKPYQRVWYRRLFDLKKDWAGQHVLLHFGAVNWEANVWLNGKKLGTHRGGYDGFSFDITDVLKKDGLQELVLSVWNPIDEGQQPRGKQVRKPHGIMYTASTGIWQTVWLEPVQAAHIQSLDIVPEVDGGKVRIRINTVGASPQDMIAVNVEDHGKRVASAAGAPGQELAIPVPHAKLWTPEHPFLYTFTATLFHQGGRDT
ncbi:MAG TPA: beta-galactosidase, partial [Gemmataceae bacterium]|nr:beta-galactosidase [Gemmataceae bacterium]